MKTLGSLSDILAVISTLLSSIALIGVIVGLWLQARQLRINSVQTFKAGYAELIRMVVDYPQWWSGPSDGSGLDPDLLRRYNLMNWQIQHFQFGYSIRAIPEAGLRFNLSNFFSSLSRQEWWSYARESYRIDANSRREKRFFEIVDSEHRSAVAKNANNPSPQVSSEE